MRRRALFLIFLYSFSTNRATAAGEGAIGEFCFNYEPDSFCTYAVQPGDTLASIAHRHGVSLHHLIAVNNLMNPDLIFVGQVLRLPNCAGASMPQPPMTGPPSRGQTYVVRPGDTLSQIAARRSVSVEYLCQLNGLADPNFIYVGQVLIIP